MELRTHLSYANVASTIALVIAVGTGGAYAAGKIGSDDIKNGAVKSVDVHDRGLKGKDVGSNVLKGKQIDEKSLVATGFAKVSGDQALTCDPTGVTYVNCATTTIDVPTSTRAFVVATGAYFTNEAGGGSSNCEVRIDGAVAAITQMPGESTTTNTSSTATDGFARSLVTPALDPGPHEFALACNQPTLKDAQIADPTIAVLALTTS
jgi:hypothetical protein